MTGYDCIISAAQTQWQWMFNIPEYSVLNTIVLYCAGIYMNVTNWYFISALCIYSAVCAKNLIEPWPRPNLRMLSKATTYLHVENMAEDATPAKRAKISKLSKLYRIFMSRGPWYVGLGNL